MSNPFNVRNGCFPPLKGYHATAMLERQMAEEDAEAKRQEALQRQIDRAEREAEAAALYAEAEAAQWDDDPNPYHGDYSEM